VTANDLVRVSDWREKVCVLRHTNISTQHGGGRRRECIRGDSKVGVMDGISPPTPILYFVGFSISVSLLSGHGALIDELEFTIYVYFLLFCNIGNIDNGVMALAGADQIQTQELTEAETLGSRLTDPISKHTP
jgi:hypothetical protein